MHATTVLYWCLLLLALAPLLLAVRSLRAQ